MVIEGITVESINISIEKTFSGSMLLCLNERYSDNRPLPLLSLACLCYTLPLLEMYSHSLHTDK